MFFVGVIVAVLCLLFSVTVLAGPAPREGSKWRDLVGINAIILGVYMLVLVFNFALNKYDLPNRVDVTINPYHDLICYEETECFPYTGKPNGLTYAIWGTKMNDGWWYFLDENGIECIRSSEAFSCK